MLESYFFIPANKQKYLDKIDSLQSDYIVIDLEDAVAEHSKKQAFDLALTVDPKNNIFVRVPFFENCYSKEQIIKLVNHFEGRIVIPKLREKEQLIQLRNLVGENLIMILLVENPLCFINFPEILTAFSKQIKSIGFGSHDFCSLTGIKHTAENLAQYKRELILYSKAFGVDYVDGVDLNLHDFTQFKKECLFAFEIGASGKFLIHPAQIDEFEKIQYFSDDELEEMMIVYDHVKDFPVDSIEVYIINGKIYEKPHIIRIKFIMNKINKSNFN